MGPGIPIGRIPEQRRADLLKTEPYKPRIFGLEGGEETGLLMRVKDLAPFQDPDFPIAVKLVGYRSEEGTWVIGIVLSAAGLPQGTLAAAAYLNPRQVIDYELLLGLSKQAVFPIILLSEHMTDSESITLSWSAVQRDEVLDILSAINRSPAAHRRGGGFDPDFEEALVEFQSEYSFEDLLK